MYKSFRAAVLRESFISAGDSVLVGVSGGVDSMVLLSLLLELQQDIDFALSVAHVNYGLRGEESDDQEKLVRDFCLRNYLRCFFSNPKLFETQKDNLQNAARDFRYHYFSEMALETGVNRVAVAHHKEDQVETILGHLLRGSSLKGLAGMQTVRKMQNSKIKDQNLMLIRPLLTFSKEEIKKYAAENKVSYLEDSSNLSKEYWRNQLRHDLLPVLEKLRPKAFDKIVQLGDDLREVADFLTITATDWLKEFSRKEEDAFWMPRPRWATLPRPLRLEVLHQAVKMFATSERSEREGEAPTALPLEGATRAPVIVLKDLKRDHLVRCEQIALGEKPEGYYHLPAELRFVRQGDSLLLSKSCVNLRSNK
ncbi:MAG: tRNA lysidine(34) synthetase TilS [Deltaproteobacteria bacterium]|nr:tRNA lysidine(34) synthetase TilS [Deltaproteobacteria bacterium]